MNSILPKIRRFFAFSLALVLMLLCVPARAFANQENTPKEEVVYINLNAAGAVEEINVVNIFNLAQAGVIVDFGAYETLRNMTSTSSIEYQDDMVTIQADAGKLYYEGKLSSNVIPWNIEIDYFLDGEEYSPEEIAGKTGALKIVLDITRNEEYQGNFFDAFALQVSLTMDTAKCSNIVAPDATVANVGSKKQLTHTILPGKGAHLEITADVVDFTMDGVSINGIPLNLKVEVDNEALMGEVDQLLEAIAKLDDGAASLRDGISSLQQGTKNELVNGAWNLQNGADALVSGAAELCNGGTTLRDGAKELENGAGTLNDGVQSLNNGVIKMQTALNALHGESAALTGGSDAYLAALTQLQTSLNGIAVTNSDISALTESSAKVLAGLTQLATGAQTLEQRVSFAALKAVMAQNELDVDALKTNNAAAMEQLRVSIDANQQLVESLKLMGYDLSGLFAQLEQVIVLLGANNAFIDGTGAYLETVNGSLSELAYSAALLQTNYSVFDGEISKLGTTLNTLAENMTALTNAVNTLVTEYGKIDGGIDAYTGAVAEIVAAYTEIANGSALLAASSTSLKTGAATLHQGTSDLLNGALALSQGTVNLRAGAGSLNAGITELVSGIAKLYDGSAQLENGTSTFRDETAGMDETINNQIDDMLSEITGENTPVSSFVTEKNANVDSVQFVIQTSAIDYQPEPQGVEDAVRELTFWEKLLNLFGLLD